MIKKFGEKRFFLNPKEGIAAGYFYAQVDNELKPRKDHWPRIDAECGIELSDCSRKISLDFEIWISDTKKKTLKNIREKRAKLARLRVLINEFADAADGAYDYLESKLDEYYEARKKKAAEEKKTKGKKKKTA